MLAVMLLDGLALGVYEFQADDFEVSSFDSAGDFADQIALNTPWLDEYKWGFNLLAPLLFRSL